MHYELGMVTIYGTGPDGPQLWRASRMSPQGLSEFWTGVRVKDSLNDKQATRGLDRALSSLQELGWECIGRSLSIGRGNPCANAIVRKAIARGPSYEYSFVSLIFTEPQEKGTWFSKPDLLDNVVVILVTPEGAIETSRERLSGEPGAAPTFIEALVKDLYSDGWKRVGSDQSINSLDIILVREIQNQDDAAGGEREVSQSQKEDQDPLTVLERLAKLRDMGAISNDEYDEKKTELLKRL